MCGRSSRCAPLGADPEAWPGFRAGKPAGDATIHRADPDLQGGAGKRQRNIRSCGLNTSEFGVLELLYNKGPHPLQQIGGKILVTSGTITYVIDKLAQKGLLIRRKKNRRSHC